MSAGRSSLIRRLYDQIRDLEPSARAEALDRHCAHDPQLRAEVERLLSGGSEQESATASLPPGPGGPSDHLFEEPEPEVEPSPRKMDTADVESSVDLDDDATTIGGTDWRRLESVNAARYEMQRILGRGGFGVVYLAQQLEPIQRPVALKVIKLGMDTVDIMARFELERQALARMSHPNIATVFDAGATDEGRPYFAMEYVPGIPVTTYCDSLRKTTRQRIELFISICEAVQHAHQKGIIHRDLKPSNVLVMEADGTSIPKVIDFGIAKAVGPGVIERTVLTRRGEMIGTPRYMSPEQAGATPEDVDTRTDIYSLGILLYELLVGDVPFFDGAATHRQDAAEIRRIIRESDPTKPSSRLLMLKERAQDVALDRQTDLRTLHRQIRGELDWIIMRALEKDQARRYASASEFAADLNRYLKHEPVAAGPPGLLYRLQKFARRHRTGLATTSGTLAALIILPLGVVRLQERQQLREAVKGVEQHLANGNSLLARSRRYEDQFRTLTDQWKKVERETDTWAPVWERDEELAARNRLTTARERAAQDENEAVIAFSNALEAAPLPELKHQAKVKLEEIYWSGYQASKRGGSQERSTEYFKKAIKDLGVGTHQRELEGKGQLSLRTEPAGADVYCFRYERHDERMVPLPYHPARGILARPILQVEAIWREGAGPFRVDDRLLAVNDVSLALLSDLARILQNVKADEVVKATIDRSGSRTVEDWVPFPASFYEQRRQEDPDSPVQPGRLLSCRDQLGVTFAGYPLQFHKDARLGTTQEAAAPTVELPEGRYLLVFRKDGYEDARLPVAMPNSGLPPIVRLVREDESPPGFIYVPAGPFSCGGDPEAFQGLEWSEVDVEGFFISRYEVTVGEYLEFLHHPEVREKTEIEDGTQAWLDPFTDTARAALAKSTVAGDRVRLVRDRMDWTWDETQQEWQISDQFHTAWPILHIPQVSAIEYAAWKTRHDPDGWIYRLPTDHEWEKAARGADRRIYVWGNYLVWNFCWNPAGTYAKGLPEVVGVSPFDESVYGVRDLAGSVAEYTVSRSTDRHRYVSRRGGHWDTTDEYEFRIATRNGMLPWGSSQYIGFRLVAEMRPEDRRAGPSP